MLGLFSFTNRNPNLDKRDEGNEFYVATEEDLSTFFVGLSDNQIRYCTAEKAI